jgi:hypothetical protein
MDTVHWMLPRPPSISFGLGSGDIGRHYQIEAKKCASKGAAYLDIIVVYKKYITVGWIPGYSKVHFVSA